MFQSMTYIGLQSTEAVNALLLSATSPLYVVIIAWALLIVRVLQNLWDDIGRWRRREPFLVDIQAIGKG